MEHKEYLELLELKSIEFDKIMRWPNYQIQGLDEKISLLRNTLNKLLPPFSFFIGDVYKEKLYSEIGEIKIYYHYDHIGREIYKNNYFYEGEMLNYIKSLKIKGNYIDVGANIGNHSLFFSQMADRVYSFEPNFSNYTFLLKNIKENNIENIYPYNYAIGLKDVLMTSNEVYHNMGMNTLIEDNNGTIRCYKGDEFNLDNISIMKIDCENMSYDVLQSFEKTIEYFKPDIFIEGDPEILTYVKERGWKIIQQFNSTPTYHIKTKI